MIVRACREHRARCAQQREQQRQPQPQRFSYPQDNNAVAISPPEATFSHKGDQGMMGKDFEYNTESHLIKMKDEGEEKEELAFPPPPYDLATSEAKVGSADSMSQK